MTVIHDFQKSLDKSHAQEDAPWWDEVYEKAFPTMIHSFSAREDGWWQRAGIDRIITLDSTTQIKIDEKVRSENWPDILIEHWSDVDRQVPGWGHRDKKLACDYIAYALIPSRKCYLLPYQTLRRVIKLNGESWWAKANRRESGFRLVPAKNRGYTTLSYAVPTDVLLDAIRDCMIITWEG